MRQQTATVRRNGAARSSSPHGEAWGALTRTHAAVTQRLQDALAQARLSAAALV